MLRLLQLWQEGFSRVVACRLSCVVARGISAPWSVIELVFPALEGGFLTTGPSGKPQLPLSYLTSLSSLLQCPWKCRPVHHEGIIISSLTCTDSRFFPFLVLVLFCFADHCWTNISSCVCGVCLEVGWLGAEKSHCQPWLRYRWSPVWTSQRASQTSFRLDGNLIQGHLTVNQDSA